MIWHWRKSKAVNTVDAPVIGASYELTYQTSDPFPPKARTIATVLDVRNGWVRYSLSSMFNDERMTVDTFMRIYSPL